MGVGVHNPSDLHAHNTEDVHGLNVILESILEKITQLKTELDLLKLKVN